MYSITKNGQCAKHLCVIDEKAKSVYTTENGLVFDFSDETDWNFKTGSGCTFITCWGCTFDTSYGCTFKTGYGCTVDTGSDCTFNTGSYCTFDTGDCCTFITGYGCTFNTGYGCTFNTSYGCTFNTGWGCTFKVGENCCHIRYDVKGVTELPVDVTIKLKGDGEAGYWVNTQEWASKYMNDEEGVVFVLKNDEFTDLLVD